MLAFALVVALGQSGLLTNPSFEVDDGWTGLIVSDDREAWIGSDPPVFNTWAPPHGERFALVESGSRLVSQPIRTEEGRRYALRVWVRRTNMPGVGAKAVANVQVRGASGVIERVQASIGPRALSGAPEKILNDDGGNVWIDGDWRMQSAGWIFAQPIEDDPIDDPWIEVQPVPERGPFVNPLFAPILIPGRLHANYGNYVTQDGPEEDWFSEIHFLTFEGEPPDYEWSEERTVVLTHRGGEQPWTFDPHLFWDREEERLWMTWGGGTIYVSEMDPDTGKLLGDPSDTLFATHPESMHVPVAVNLPVEGVWDGDAWSEPWVEGGSLWKRDGWFYLLVSHGSLADNYTMRVGRSRQPTGPFLDKQGHPMTDLVRDRSRYGGSLLLGSEGHQFVPGHPHVWQEGQITYLGYDYNPPGATPENEIDLFGVRKLHWSRGWPTVWTPVDLEFVADGPIQVELAAGGEDGARLGFDDLTLRPLE